MEALLPKYKLFPKGHSDINDSDGGGDDGDDSDGDGDDTPSHGLQKVELFWQGNNILKPSTFFLNSLNCTMLA